MILKVEYAVLQDELENLESLALESEASAKEKNENNENKSDPIYENVYQIHSIDGRVYYKDLPPNFKGDFEAYRLRGRDEIINVIKYLEDNTRTAFVVGYSYNASKYSTRSVGHKEGKLVKDRLLIVLIC